MIELISLDKTFDTPAGPVQAVRDVTMTVKQGDICVLLGPSGCGKTTTLKMINRLILKTSGRILIDGDDTDQLDAVTLRRQIGYVIQQIGLFPNMTIEDNVCSVPDLLGWDKGKSRKRAAELLDLVNLDPSLFLKRYPKELSGGQQQRAGVARALAAEPKLMLMDEPFGAIDPINREVIQDEFLKLQKEFGTTVIFVSHDLYEAIKMGDQIAIFNEGQLIQSDSPDRLLSRPNSSFIEDFLGAERSLRRLSLFPLSVIARDESAPADAISIGAHLNLREALNRLLETGTEIAGIEGGQQSIRLSDISAFLGEGAA